MNSAPAVLSVRVGGAGGRQFEELVGTCQDLQDWCFIFIHLYTTVLTLEQILIIIAGMPRESGWGAVTKGVSGGGAPAQQGSRRIEQWKEGGSGGTAPRRERKNGGVGAAPPLYVTAHTTSFMYYTCHSPLPSHPPLPLPPMPALCEHPPLSPALWLQ